MTRATKAKITLKRSALAILAGGIAERLKGPLVIVTGLLVDVDEAIAETCRRIAGGKDHEEFLKLLALLFDVRRKLDRFTTPKRKRAS